MGNTKNIFPTFYDAITLPNIVKYTCCKANGFKRETAGKKVRTGIVPTVTAEYAQSLHTGEIHIQNSCAERSIQMPEIMIIECSDEEADRLVEQIKDIVTEHECQPFRGPGKVYEFGPLRIDQPKREVTLHGNAVKLS